MENENKFDSELFLLEELLSNVENDKCLNIKEESLPNLSKKNTKMKSDDYEKSIFETEFKNCDNFKKNLDICDNSESKNGENKNFSKSNVSKTIVNNVVEQILDYRIDNLLMPKNYILERTTGRKQIGFSQIAAYIHKNNFPDDWFMAGVLAKKNPIRETKKGSPFSAWQLTDLKPDSKTVSLYLFNNAHTDFWKTTIGNCVAVLNPSVFEKLLENKDVGSFSVNTGNNILILGQSKDFGFCKARTQLGKPCTIVINLQDSEFCLYHLKNSYGKYFQDSKTKLKKSGNSSTALQNKILGKHEVFYGGQCFSSVPVKKTKKLCVDGGKINIFSSELSTKLLQKNSTENNMMIQGHQKDAQQHKIFQDKILDKPVLNNFLSSKSTKLNTCNFSNSSSKVVINGNNGIRSNLKKATYLRQIASEIIKKSPVEKLDPNSTRGTREGKYRLSEKFEIDSKRQKLNLSNENEKISRLESIINKKSYHTNLIDLHDNCEQEKHFEKLEKKESIEEKMLKTYKVPTKAYMCRDCKYSAFSLAEHCKNEKHAIKVVEAEKRFFQCKDCGYRTVSLYKIPKVSCNKCTGSRWKRVAMISEIKFCPNSELLSIRGDEEKFVGSTLNKVNINLLVPDET